MSRFVNHICSFFPKLQKDFKIYEGKIFSEIYKGDFYENIPFEKYINFSVPVPNENVYSILSYGAVPNNSRVNNAHAINSAIANCSEKGGGIVLIEGGSFTSGTVFFKSNVALFIAKDSEIKASHNINDYITNTNTPDNRENYIKNGLILAQNCKNVALLGPGKICGEGNYFSLKPYLPPKTEHFSKALDVWDMRQEYRKRIRFAHNSKYGFLVHFQNCEQVKISNIILENSAFWTLNINMCSDVAVTHTVINNNRHVANSDGIDISGSSNVTVEKCFVSTGDDGIVIKNSHDIACEKSMNNIYVGNCEVISCTNSFKIGTETSLDISDVKVENCKFYLTDIFPSGASGIALESCDGAVVSNISIKNIEIDSMACPIFLRLNNRNRNRLPDLDKKGELKNINISDVVAVNSEIPVIIMGIPSQKIDNVILKNISVKYADGKDYRDLRFKVPEQEKEYPESNRFRNLNAYGIYVRHAKNISVEKLRVIPREHTKRKFKIVSDCENFSLKK